MIDITKAGVIKEVSRMFVIAQCTGVDPTVLYFGLLAGTTLNEILRLSE